MRSKYKNKKVTHKGIKFHSKMECNRYKELVVLLRNGTIEQLELQPSFKLLDGFKIKTEKGLKTIYPVSYISDFKYIKNGLVVIEDTKGFETADYKIKKKMFLLQLDKYNVDIFREVKEKSTIDFLR